MFKAEPDDFKEYIKTEEMIGGEQKNLYKKFDNGNMKLEVGDLKLVEEPRVEVVGKYEDVKQAVVVGKITKIAHVPIRNNVKIFMEGPIGFVFPDDLQNVEKEKYKELYYKNNGGILIVKTLDEEYEVRDEE